MKTRNRNRKTQGINLSIAQLKWAFKKLTGMKLESNPVFAVSPLTEAGTFLWTTYGEAKIMEAIADYSVDTYLNSNEY